MDVSKLSDDLQELKTRLIGKKAVYENYKTQVANAKNKLHEYLSTIDEATYEYLESHGYSVDFIKNLDVDRLSSDEAYLQNTKASIESIATRLYEEILQEV